jgi:hypothetical protein
MRHTVQGFAASMLVSFVVSGCAVDAQGSAPTEEDVGSSSAAYSVVPQYQMPLGWHGGTGGTYDATSERCGAGNVAVGLWGQVRAYDASFSWVYRLGLVCATLERDGSLSPSWSLPMTAGSQSNTYTAYSMCPSGYVMVGIGGRAATYLDGIFPLCEPATWVGRGVAPQGASTQSLYLGGAGGNSYGDDCPAHYAITSLTTRHGDWVDGAQANCTYIAQ